MYNIEINNRIDQIVELFHRFGLWRIEDDSSVFLKAARKLKYFIFQVGFVITLLLGGLFSDDKSESVLLATVSIAVLVITVKLLYVLWKKKEILAFIQEVSSHSFEDYEEFVKVNEKVEKLMKFSFGLFLFTCVSAGILLILPVFSSDKKLPYNIWLPLNLKNNAIVYWLAYAYIVTTIIINLVGTLFNIIIWYIMMNCAIKYQILGNQIKNIFLPKPTIRLRNISKDEEENLFLQELIDLIKIHRNIKKTIDRFRSCFGNLFFAQITTSGVGICGSVYILAFLTFESHNVTLFQYYCSLLSYHFFDIFMVMYLGNEIKLSSDRLSYCLFKLNWLERSESCKRCMITLTEVLKQPHELLIGKLYPLNLETFISIVKLVYSMFNILKKLN